MSEEGEGPNPEREDEDYGVTPPLIVAIICAIAACWMWIAYQPVHRVVDGMILFGGLFALVGLLAHAITDGSRGDSPPASEV